jgi:hypothetical protein
MGFAFAAENMPCFFCAFVFAPLRLFGTADVGANLVASDNLLFGRSDWFFLPFSHYQVPLSSVRINIEVESQDSLIEPHVKQKRLSTCRLDQRLEEPPGLVLEDRLGVR